MTRRERLAVGGALVALSAAASVLAAPRLPATLATQFSAGGAVVGTMPKAAGLALLPALAAALLALFEALPRIDPLGENVAALGSYYDLLVLTVVGLPAYVHLLIVGVNLGYDVGLARALAPVPALLYYVVGVVTERVEPNWFVGVRTPWTLSDERVWVRTHERSGPLFKIAGVLALGGAVLPAYFVVFAVGPAVPVAAYATVFSYLDYRRLNADGARDGR